MDGSRPASHKDHHFPVSFKDGQCVFEYRDSFKINFETGEVQ